MPSYKVLQKGFYGGRQYDPAGKRPVLHTDKPFPSKNGKEQVPSWLEATAKPETPAQAKARKAAETKAANAAKKQAEQDQKVIAEASFMGEGESGQSAVETL